MHWFSIRKNFIIMLLPVLIIYCAYIIVPLFVAVYYSFTDFGGIRSPNFVGLKNYIDLFSDKFFLVSVKNTLIVLMMSFLILLPGSFLLALVLNNDLKYFSVFKALNFLPNIIAPIIVGLIWRFIFDPTMGLINTFLDRVGLGTWKQQWIGGLVLTPYSVGIIYAWQNIGYLATIFLAGLKAIPQDIYEAGAIDGVNSFQRIIYITLPMLKETFTIVIILLITGCIKIFEIVYQLTNGAPNHMSEVLTTYMYNTTFVSSKYGYGMSIATFICLISMISTFVYLRTVVNRPNVEG